MLLEKPVVLILEAQTNTELQGILEAQTNTELQGGIEMGSTIVTTNGSEAFCVLMANLTPTSFNVFRGTATLLKMP